MNLSSDAPMEDEPVKKAVPNSITIASLLSLFWATSNLRPARSLVVCSETLAQWTPRAWPLEPRRKLEIVLVPQSEWYVQLCEDTGTTVGIIIVSFEEYDSTVLAVESKNLYSVIKKMVSPWCRWFPNPKRMSSFRRRESWWLTRQSPFPGSVQYAPTLMNIKF